MARNVFVYLQNVIHFCISEKCYPWNHFSKRLVFLLLLLCLSGLGALYGQEVNLSGVLHTEDGQPIRGARILLTGSENQEIQTGQNGFYEFTVQQGGSFTIQACLDQNNTGWINHAGPLSPTKLFSERTGHPVTLCIDRS